MVMPQPLPLDGGDASELTEQLGEDEPEAVAAPQTSDPLKLYVRQIGDGRLLTREEERELARRKDAGDEDAKRRLIGATCGWSCRLPGTTGQPACRCSISSRKATSA